MNVMMGFQCFLHLTILLCIWIISSSSTSSSFSLLSTSSYIVFSVNGDGVLELQNRDRIKTRHLSKKQDDIRLKQSASKSPRKFPSLQYCFDTGEAYSASYLVNKKHLIDQRTEYNLSSVNCELASFMLFHRYVAFPPKKIEAVGSIVQTVDMLDFSVLHLSVFERLIGRWSSASKSINLNQNNFTVITNAANILQQQALLIQQYVHHQAPLTPQLDKTVVVMPYLGVDRGIGHSRLVNRQYYLHACFWSYYTFYKNIVIAVKSIKDAIYIRKTLKLPVYDIILFENLPRSAALPVATVQAVKELLLHDRKWSEQFDYMFYTESDQVLIMRSPDEYYAYVDENPRNLVLPHRLTVYPDQVVQDAHKKDLEQRHSHDWLDYKCCVERQHCTDRKAWQYIRNDSVSIFQIYGMMTALGHVNFHKEMYRPCTLYHKTEVPNNQCP